jgi:hypothetical protein
LGWGAGSLVPQLATGKLAPQDDGSVMSWRWRKTASYRDF